MMTDFYGDNLDLWAWPVTIDATNDEIQVTEDYTEGGAQDTFTVTLTHSGALANNATYYAIAGTDPDDGSGAGNIKIIDGDGEEVYVRPLYSEIASELTANSPNNHTYSFTAHTLSGSESSRTSITLESSSENRFRLEPDQTSNSLSIRYFGFDEGAGNQLSDSSGVLDGNRSRWGAWYSPVVATDKRQIRKRQTFASGPDPHHRLQWRWTREAKRREIAYVGVPGVHVWAGDRASRSAEADRGGVVLGDANNALQDLWQHTGFDDAHVLIGHGQGEQPLGNIVVQSLFASGLRNDSEAAIIDREWLSQFAPQQQTDREHQGEKYDITIPVSVNLPSQSTLATYEH